MADQGGLYGDKAQGIIARAKAIILTPDAEWPVIDGEAATVGSLYTGYIMILAAIGPIATFLHSVVFGYGAFGVTYRPPFFGSVATAIVSYALQLAGAYVMALIIDALAPTFQGQKSPVQALKLVAYSSTAAWLAGIFSLVPWLGILGLLGLYSLYLFYRGLPVMMKCPADKALPYTAVVIVVAIIVFAIISSITTMVVGGSMMAGNIATGSLTTQDKGGGSVTLPGGTTFDLGKLQQAAKSVEDSAARAQSGSHPAGVATDTLKKLLPDSIGGMSRQEYTGSGGQIAGIGGSTVEAKYGSGDKRVTLDVTDMGEMGAFAALGGALGISGDQETPTSYSKVRQVDGRTVAEEYDRQAHHGSYAVVVANRFLVKAEGNGVSMDDIKAAAGKIDLGDLEALAK